MTMKLACYVAVAASLTLMLSTPAKANWNTGQLLNGCERLDRTLKISGETVNFTQDFETNYCWAFMAAMQQTSAMYVDGKSLLGACAPAATTLTQHIKVFINWANRHPQHLHQQAAASVWQAMNEAFPCAKR